MSDKYLDKKEIELIESLTKEYERFIEPGFITKNFRVIKGKVLPLIPQKIQDSASDLTKKVSESELIKQALEVASKGFLSLQEQSAKLTISKNSIMNDISSKNNIKIS